MVDHFRHLRMLFLIHCHEFHPAYTVILRQLSTILRKSVLKLTDIFPDFIIHGHKFHGLFFHGHNDSFTLRPPACN